MSASPAAGDDVSQGGETPIVEEPRCGVMSDGFLLLNRIGHDALFRSVASGVRALQFRRALWRGGDTTLRVGECLLLNENEGTSLPETP